MSQICVIFRSISRDMCYLAMTLAVVMQVSAQVRRDGEILGSKPHVPLPPFDSLDNFGRSLCLAKTRSKKEGWSM